MKQRLYILAFLAFTVAFTSCNKNDDPEPVPVVVGKWSVDYGILIRGFSNNPEDIFVNGDKIDPSAPILRDGGSVLTTIHLMEAGNAFVSIEKFIVWAETSKGTWDYTNAPTLRLKYENLDRDLTYSVVDGLEQLHYNEVDTDDDGNQTEIQWVFHR